MSTTTLYERLGGETNIRAIAADIFDNHSRNPLVQTRFAQSNRDRMIAVVTQFVCMGTGGPQKYEGQDMRTAHQGMNISEQEYLSVVDDIMAALDKHQVGAGEKQEVLSIAYALKGEIIRV